MIRHRKNDGFRQGSEQKLGYTRQTKDGDEDDTDAERRNQCRQYDLNGTVPNRFQLWLFLAHVAMNIFDANRGVVHQYTHR